MQADNDDYSSSDYDFKENKVKLDEMNKEFRQLKLQENEAALEDMYDPKQEMSIKKQ